MRTVVVLPPYECSDHGRDLRANVLSHLYEKRASVQRLVDAGVAGPKQLHELRALTIRIREVEASYGQ